MSIIKSLSVGNGDMFYIKHNSDNFTTIDCCLSEDNKKEIVDEIKREKNGKNISRFISTHPDEDHIQKLDYFDDEIGIDNFYVVENETTKSFETDGFKRYKKLHNSNEKSLYIQNGTKRKWMNMGDETRSSSGLSILWPIRTNEYFKTALQNAKEGKSPNDISCIIKYSLEDGVTAIWMGDLEKEFMENIKNEITFSKVNILFAPHHGRKSAKIPQEWIDQMNPDIIVMGEANSNNSDYASYPNHNKIRQNSAKNITFECESGKVHIYSSNENYSVDFLKNENKNTFDYYLGTLEV
jgi:beta-lactamase superfamily II metal-dependent hydrolase